MPEPKRKGQRICLFGGTFDPIHEAHLRIAEEALTTFSLDKILFIPAAHPPHKDPAAVTPYEERFRMVELACAPYPQFQASRLEEGAEQSYTVDTLRRFRTQLSPADDLFFLIGSDAFEDLESWKEWQDVVAMTEFIVVSRPGADYRVPQNARVHRLTGLALPVSSSTIRARLAAGEPTPELPTPVRQFIEENGLYRFGTE
ncbi:MAG TPA: nicotinate-nucleotide adenylyltransferase [Bryobacteraceae bacterium]|nr:nicotinate-nucleotide adenylyltransferase [Bryobacteraceae bacterium]